MEGLQLTGLASGLDWQSLVDQLIQIERIPQDRLRQKQAELNVQSSAMGDLSDLLKDLQTSVNDLASEESVAAKKVSLADTDSTVLSAQASASTPAARYEVTVSQLATATKRTGAADVGARLNSDSDVSGLSMLSLRTSAAVSEGYFTVNGQKVEFELTDSLGDVLDAIGTATGNDVTASYNATNDTIELTSSSAITLGSAGDTSNFLTAMKLFGNGTSSVSSLSALGSADLGETIDSAGLSTAVTAVDGDGVGSVDINGVTISYDISDDSLFDVMQRINNSEAGVNVSYDPTQDGFTMTSTETGTLGIAINESAGGLLAAMGLTTGASDTIGQNAQYSINGGGTITSNSNTFTQDTHGISGLSVTALEANTETVIVEPDIEVVREGIDAFIEKYNEVQTFIDATTGITSGDNGSVQTSVFTGRREIEAIAGDLRSEIFDSVDGLSGAVKRLQDIGIDFTSGSNSLFVEDESALEDAIRNDSGSVFTLFADETDGLATRLDAYIDSIVENDGLIDDQQESITRQTTRLDDQIESLERYIQFQRQQLERSFINLEEVQSSVNQDLQIINSTFSG